MQSRARVLSSKIIYRGRIVQLKVDEIIEPGNVRAIREIVAHPGSVVILAQCRADRLLLVRQYRYAAGRPLWELVAGGIERGETVREAARRELLEETGYKARFISPLISFYPSPGILSEQMHLVEAKGLVKASAHPDPDERIHVGLFSRARLRRMICRRQIHDGKTLVGLFWLFSHGAGPKP